MKRFILARDAEQDLIDIHDYLREEAGARVARQVLKQLKDAIVFLSRAPNSGHSREDLTDAPVKFWSVHSYLVVYKSESRPIEIARIIHGGRDITKLFWRDEG